MIPGFVILRGHSGSWAFILFDVKIVGDGENSRRLSIATLMIRGYPLPFFSPTKLRWWGEIDTKKTPEHAKKGENNCATSVLLMEEQYSWCFHLIRMESHQELDPFPWSLPVWMMYQRSWSWGFFSHGETPKSRWMLYFMENPSINGWELGVPGGNAKFDGSSPTRTWDVYTQTPRVTHTPSMLGFI